MPCWIFGIERCHIYECKKASKNEGGADDEGCRCVFDEIRASLSPALPCPRTLSPTSLRAWAQSWLTVLASAVLLSLSLSLSLSLPPSLSLSLPLPLSHFLYVYIYIYSRGESCCWLCYGSGPTAGRAWVCNVCGGCFCSDCRYGLCAGAVRALCGLLFITAVPNTKRVVMMLPCTNVPSPQGRRELQRVHEANLPIVCREGRMPRLSRGYRHARRCKGGNAT
jgi:hypothetical protein